MTEINSIKSEIVLIQRTIDNLHEEQSKIITSRNLIDSRIKYLRNSWNELNSKLKEVEAEGFELSGKLDEKEKELSSINYMIEDKTRELNDKYNLLNNFK